MHNAINLLSIVLLAIGLLMSFRSRQYRTEAGKSTPWFQQWSPFWKENPYYSKRGQELARISGVSMGTGALLMLISLWVV